MWEEVSTPGTPGGVDQGYDHGPAGSREEPKDLEREREREREVTCHRSLCSFYKRTSKQNNCI